MNPSRILPGLSCIAMALVAACGVEQVTAIRGDVGPPPDTDNLAPVAAFSVRCEGLACWLTDESTDPDADDLVVRRLWNFGDGRFSNLPEAFHEYDEPGGRFSVTLIVYDNHRTAAKTAKSLDVTKGTDVAPPHAGQIAFARDG